MAGARNDKENFDESSFITTVDPATEAKQDTGNASLASIDGKLPAGGLATSAKQDTGNTSLSSIDGKITACNTGAVVVSSGAITETNSGTIAGDTTSIDGKIPAKGSANMAGSIPTTLATDDTQYGAVGAASDVDGNIHGQLRYIGEAVDNIPAVGAATSAASLPVVPATDIADATYIGDIKFGEALPVGTNLIGNVGHGKTLVTVTGTVSADTDIVAAVAAKRIKVIAFSLISASTTTNTITFQSNASTALWTTPLQAISGTIAGSNMAVSAPSFLFATVAGEKLTLDVSAAQSVTYNVAYFADDAT